MKNRLPVRFFARRFAGTAIVAVGILLIAHPQRLGAQSNTSAAHFLSYPCLSPDGQTVVFSFEGDLWTASVKGGQANRLTAMLGYETSARFSPDGKWIAFTGRQAGNADVYVMPVGGGEIKQLTFHSANDDVNSWSWDSKFIYFTSTRSGQQSGYKVSVNGGTPLRIFGSYYFLYDHNLFEHPSSGEIFFNDTWESSSQVQRKHYKGPFNPDIQSYNPRTKQYKRYTDYIGKDFGATLDKSGNIYFISDEGNGEYNLYTFAGGKKTALTSYKSSIRNAIVNAEGGKVVFEKDYQLYVYDVKAGSAQKLDIAVTRNYTLPTEKDFDLRGSISNLDVSPDGKKLAFTARGELFVSDIDGKFIHQVEKGSAERADEVKWMSDNKTLLFNQTSGGYLNWFTIAADGSAPLKQLTSDVHNNRSVHINKLRTKAVYLCGRDELRLMDLKSMESKTVVKDEFWALQSSDPGFSPDGNYICYTAHRNFEEDIFVYDIRTGKSTDVTNTAVAETNPHWSADGKYIYFISSRLKPSYPFGMENPKVYRLPLRRFQPPFRSDKFMELFKTEKKDTGAAVKKDSLTQPIVIEASHIMERIEQISPSLGSQFLVDLVEKGSKTTVLYMSNHDSKFSLWKTVLEPFEENKTEKINGADASGNLSFVAAGDKNFLVMGGNVYKVNLDGNKVDPLLLTYSFRRNLAGEFAQMFFEAWALVEENYYDEKFHGLDWKATRDHYASFLPYLNNRNDLRVLLNDMLGELNSSHQGFFTFGGDENVQYNARTMETGIIFEEEDPYKVKYIVRRSAADHEGIDVQPGDELVKVNGVAIDPQADRDMYFTKPSLDRELQMTFRRMGQTFEVNVHPQGSLGLNLYDEWIDDNRKRVEEKSKGRIAYTCMKNMGTQELEHFIVDMTQELEGKDGLILDIRYNTGGNVHDEVLKFLAQRSYLQWKYREGQLTRQGNFTPSDKPIVLLTNEQSLSDAEMTATGFKALKLGKIVGNETYHWIIFTSGAGLVDGSFVRLPSWGCYTLDGKDIESYGVQPDIKVMNSFEDKIGGRDPQVDRAVEEVLKSAGSR
jgi:Tol biopolymer transport system component/C-terminal processing protease CtpA/Prc